jgi:23S rRNA pseudouridine1911/1915/1917 synthase
MNRFVIDVTESGKRLDLFLAENLTDYSRSYIQQLISENKVLVDGRLEKSNHKVKLGSTITIDIPDAITDEIKPEPVNINIIYQDNDIAIINKQKGLVVHPAPGNYTGTLVNGLLYHCKDLSGINGKLRPGIVHRLDKDTSGVMVVAKNDSAHRLLAEDLKSREIKRSYIALVHGNIAEERGKIDAPIGRDPGERKRMAVVHKGSKNAITFFEVLERFGDFTLVNVNIKTGRTHQIRVHFSFIGNPVVGDEKYTNRKNSFKVKGQLLHAWKLVLKHPSTGEEMEFEAKLPKDFQTVLNELRREDVNETKGSNNG